MGKLKSLGSVSGHQANRIFIRFRSHRNHSASFAEVLDIDGSRGAFDAIIVDV